MNRKLILLSIALTISTTAYAGANFDYAQNSPAPVQNDYSLPTQTISANQTLKGRVVTVPAGEAVQAIVTTPINSANMTVGENVTLALGSDFYYKYA